MMRHNRVRVVQRERLVPRPRTHSRLSICAHFFLASAWSGEDIDSEWQVLSVKLKRRKSLSPIHKPLIMADEYKSNVPPSRFERTKEGSINGEQFLSIIRHILFRPSSPPRRPIAPTSRSAFSVLPLGSTHTKLKRKRRTTL
ncbi:hypothetical protein HGRIS_004652 [Hohenbuehelia grisea]|uniref:Uncharacterized protein n=1 Tax=Hohenbuehelia grisea TaxID=104357 RepID=A0ABR3JD49_9AGAR